MSALCSPLLDLSDAEAAAISPDELDRLERDARQRLRIARKLDSRQWGYVVEEWNDLLPNERQERRAVCLKGKHDWASLPAIGARVCKRCITYAMEDES
jgi:hypothetical protein